jgi:GNAT superfamily N-acetyltransferase
VPLGRVLRNKLAKGLIKLCRFPSQSKRQKQMESCVGAQAVGRGWGKALLKTAILTGWAREGVERMTVNTCTLDHPRALIQYQRFGFAPVRTEVHSRILTRDQVFHHPLL